MDEGLVLVTRSVVRMITADVSLVVSLIYKINVLF
jgi:hypothetical protein